MRVEWVLEYQDYLAAQNLFNRSSFWRRISIFTLKWLLPAIAIIIALLLVEKNGWSFALENGWSVLLFGFMFRFIYWLSLRKGYKRIFLNGDSTKPVYMEINDEQILSGIPGSSEGKFFWPTVLKFSEDEQIVLLYLSKRLFLIIPKNKIAPAEWSEMKQTIQRHIPGI